MIEPYYSDDHVTLYHGDCMDILPGLEFDVVVADPPYGVGHSSARGLHDSAYAGEPRMYRDSRRTITAEDVAVRTAAIEAWGESTPAIVFGGWRAPNPAGTRWCLIWDKGSIGFGGVGPWRSSFEEIYLLGEGWATTGGYLPSVIRSPRDTEINTRHPSPKPIGLMRYLVGHTPPGVICDPFAGSGTTLRAAKDLGRKAIGIEIDERYCEIAARRMGQEVLAL